jgi:hypothetical protein
MAKPIFTFNHGKEDLVRAMVPRWVKGRFSKLFVAIVIAASVAVIPSARHVRADDTPLPEPFTHRPFNGLEGTGGGDGSVPIGPYRNPPSPICTTPSSNAANVNTDCEGNAPHNETTIAVNPTNSLNMIGAANDYQLAVTPGGAVKEWTYIRAHVTFDGGQTWTTYPINYSSYESIDDPAVAFDANGTAYLATLGFRWSQSNGCCGYASTLVASSTDGGQSWTEPSRVAHGIGEDGGPGIHNDKEYITAWGNGNAAVTWTHFSFGVHGSYINSPIYASVTHDGGRTWSDGVEISGSAPFCIGAQGGTACDQDQASVPTFSNGHLYAAFLNTSDMTSFRSQYLVVELNPSTGQRIAGPYNVADLIDGLTDYPINSLQGLATYQDSQFRTLSAGNTSADPTNGLHLAVAWSDMRNSVLPAPSDPYSAITNSDIIVSQSWDGGHTWSSPVAILSPGDQFMPWAAYDSAGKLRIGYFDRSYDPANHMYGYTLATETTPGSLTFSYAQLTTAPSDPTQGDRWYSSLTVNPSFQNPTAFLGDYSGIATSPSGGVVALWTDMRLNTCFTGRCGTSEDAVFAAHP